MLILLSISERLRSQGKVSRLKSINSLSVGFVSGTRGSGFQLLNWLLRDLSLCVSCNNNHWRNLLDQPEPNPDLIEWGSPEKKMSGDKKTRSFLVLIFIIGFFAINHEFSLVNSDGTPKSFGQSVILWFMSAYCLYKAVALIFTSRNYSEYASFSRDGVKLRNSYSKNIFSEFATEEVSLDWSAVTDVKFHWHPVTDSVLPSVIVLFADGILKHDGVAHHIYDTEDEARAAMETINQLRCKE